VFNLARRIQSALFSLESFQPYSQYSPITNSSMTPACQVFDNEKLKQNDKTREIAREIDEKMKYGRIFFILIPCEQSTGYSCLQASVF